MSPETSAGPASRAKLRDHAARSPKGFPAGQRDKLINSMLRTLVDEHLAVKYPRSAKGADARRQAAKEPAKYLGGALDTTPVLREFLEARREFDEAVLALARRDIPSLHEFRGFLQVPEQEREQLVFDGKGNYYGGVAFVRPESV